MKTFEFNYENILKYKEHLYDMAKLEYQTLSSKVQMIARLEEQIQKNMQEERERLQLSLVAHASIREVRMQHWYIGQLEERKKVLGNEKEKLSVDLDAVRYKCIECKRERDQLSHLKDEQREEFVQEVDRFEQKEVDDYFNAVHVHRNHNG